MKYGTKVILLTVLPVILGMSGIVYWVSEKTQGLSSQQAQEFKSAIVDHRKNELRDHVSIVQSVVRHLRPSDSALNDTDDENEAQLIQILSSIEFSEDGYFYVYDEKGNNIVHPKQPYRIGKNWIDLQDSQGKRVISSLIYEAQSGGGFTEYLWEKPSSGQIARKIGYSEMLADRSWMIGTGAYFDDIDKQVADVQSAMNPYIQSTLLTGALIGSLAVLAVFLGGLHLQLSEKKMADNKLQHLTRRIVHTQDEERRRVSRELHDSISQSLVGVKYVLEDIQLQHQIESKTSDSLQTGIDHLDQTLLEIRMISRNLHPSILDDIGLMAAVEALVDAFEQRSGIKVDFSGVKVRNLLPEDARTALYRVVQEAFTNIERHSKASQVNLTFSIRGKWFGVSVDDNGVGFDLDTLQNKNSTKRGIGLRNMSERLNYLDGVYEISSSSAGTRIFAGVPKSLLRQPLSVWN